MSTALRDMVIGEADLDDEEEDESFDEETGETRERQRRQENMDDSSEEDDDDDDEEEMKKVREGFIIDDDDEEEEEEEDPEDARRRRKRKRRQEKEEEAQLDEEDLDLIGESIPEWKRKQPTESKFKRLKRGHREDDVGPERRGLDQMFSEDDDDAVDERPYGRPGRRDAADEFDDFIEEDYPEDEDERQRQMEDLEVARPRDKGLAGAVIDRTGLDKDALDDMDAIFGNGEEYQWALDEEEEEEERQKGEQQLELKDVFEPSQLAEKLLTDEDNAIRFADEPERFQLDRKPFRQLQISADQFKEESLWIANLMWPKKQLSGDLHGPFQKAVGKVLEYFVVEELEVPYVFQHRKDYLIHARKIRNPDNRDSDVPEYAVNAEKLLTQDDLWRILELDIKFRSLIEKRNALEKTYDSLKTYANVEDPMIPELSALAINMEELQDVQDYINFQYSSQLKDIAAMNGVTKGSKRPGAKSSTFDRVRKSRAYKLVEAYGITPDRLAQNALREAQRVIADDEHNPPIDLADSLTDSDFPTGEQVLYQARHMYAEELFMSPRMRRHFRVAFYQMGEFSCHRTEKGLRRIDESHPFFEIKYLINQTIGDLARRPELFLKMMKAEEEGLVEVKMHLQNEREFLRQLHSEFASDNYSELADAWNDERHKVLDIAFTKLERVVVKGVKDNLRTACQEELFKLCREEFSKRLDQAPYKPKGLVLGSLPRVLTLSNGMGDANRDPIYWTWVEEDGRVTEHGKFEGLARNDAQRDSFAELVERRKPDVIGVAGFSVETHKLVREIETLVNEKNLVGPSYEDPEHDDELRSDLLEVVVVNDEVARLYKDSPRAQAEHPTLNSVTRYCVALAKYLQSPMKEYAALGKDVTSLLFNSCQHLLPQDKLLKTLETSMVDMVNLCGVDVNEAVGDAYTANLLPYVAGLGPRKASSVIKAINQNGGVVNTREELVGDPDNNKLPVVGPRVWNNCASFLFIEYDATNPSSEPLDNTRVHPEDYELGRKMAADALELDEEDVKAETDESGPGAVVRKLFKDDEQEKVNELVLEEYAEQLEKNYSQRKRATLETIRAELQAPYEELRRPLASLSPDQIFVMFTGETQDSLTEGMIVPVNMRVVKDDFAIAKLDCGIEGRIEAHEVSTRSSSIRDAVHVGQTIQAKIIDLSRKEFLAKLSLREDMLRIPYRKRNDHDHGTWAFGLEREDREALKEKDSITGRTQRVINHPLFRPFNSTQAEEYLGSQASGDVVIRPSSKGNDHITITWKVADGVFQHIDVLELGKESEFAVGKTLRIGGKFTYSDLDELIVDHVKAMARKVDELMGHEKFKKGSIADVERWLTSYSDANPNRSIYLFCINPKHPGYFNLCFKASKKSNIGTWSVKAIPHAFEMMKHQYPDMRALCNGFKLRFSSEMSRMQSGRR
ncbi:SH2 domain-containing protein [Xylariaceae sp. FL0016]|nr:SH2 domain-containing protein [Xylariaceae sp. FL0016]